MHPILDFVFSSHFFPFSIHVSKSFFSKVEEIGQLYYFSQNVYPDLTFCASQIPSKLKILCHKKWPSFSLSMQLQSTHLGSQIKCHITIRIKHNWDWQWCAHRDDGKLQIWVSCKLHLPMALGSLFENMIWRLGWLFNTCHVLSFWVFCWTLYILEKVTRRLFVSLWLECSSNSLVRPASLCCLALVSGQPWITWSWLRLN